jgi:sn-glycerol 3-phosphate transport system ATP-binding protein
MAAIELRAVSKRWGDTEVLHGLDIAIAARTFCVLLGPSGCGKSTTLRIIAGLESATTGTVRIAGRDVTALPPAARGVAMVFQNYALFPHLTVADNITFGLSVRKVPKAECQARLDDTARLLGLSALLGRRPGQLSGGQQQRVALGRALVSQAAVCLMDEPLSNLDARLRQEMRRELRDLQQRLGLTVVYVTHDQTEAMSMADQVVLLDAGHVAQVGPPVELYQRPRTTFAARFIGTPPMNLVALDGGRIRGQPEPLPGFIDPAVLRAAHLIGIRPEAIHLGDTGLAATVESIEYLGADQIVRVRVGDELVLVRTAADRDRSVGDAVRLDWRGDAVHFYDAADRRLDTPVDGPIGGARPGSIPAGIDPITRLAPAPLRPRHDPANL